MKDLYIRWWTWFESIANNGQSTVSEYPQRLEPYIQKAVQYKRNGEYLASIDIYLYILESEDYIYPDLLKALYKSVLCTGLLDFAYEVIVTAEFFAKRGWGSRPTSNNPVFSLLFPNEKWHQETLRKELEERIIKYAKYANNTPDGYTVSNIVLDFEEFISPYSGQSNYKLPTVFSAQFSKIIALSIKSQFDFVFPVKKTV